MYILIPFLNKGSQPIAHYLSLLIDCFYRWLEQKDSIMESGKEPSDKNETSWVNFWELH